MKIIKLSSDTITYFVNCDKIHLITKVKNNITWINLGSEQLEFSVDQTPEEIMELINGGAKMTKQEYESNRNDLTNNYKTLMDIKDNQIMLLKEDLECVHLYLDDKKVPREDIKGKTYSIVGRIKQLEETLQRNIRR